jgi:hypothetical protein
MRTLDPSWIGHRFTTNSTEFVVLAMGYHINGEPVVTVAPVDADATERRDLGHGWTEPACVRRLEGWWHCDKFEYGND